MVYSWKQGRKEVIFGQAVKNYYGDSQMRWRNPKAHFPFERIWKAQSCFDNVDAKGHNMI